VADPFIGEIRLFAGNFAPAGWAFCAGQIVAISGNEALYQLIGTTYGGNGQSNFALPNLQSRVPVHAGTGAGSSYSLGQTGGVETVSLTVQQMPSHNHTLGASTTGQTLAPATNTLLGAATAPGQPGSTYVYRAAPENATLNPSTILNSGSSQPHTNIQPYVAVNYIIALYGRFPTQS
jgi:microcystin-dependent protein